MEIEINYFDEEYVKLFSPDGDFIDDINELQLLDIQCQICKRGLSGYYLLYNNGEKGNIDSNGEINHMPDYVFNKRHNTLLRLRELQEEKE